MATITKTYTEAGEYRSSWTVTLSFTNQTVNQASLTLNKPTVTARYVYSGKTLGYVNIRFAVNPGGSAANRTTYASITGSGPNGMASMASGATKSCAMSDYQSPIVSTEYLFNASNKTSRTVNVTAVAKSTFLRSSDASFNKDARYSNDNDINWGTIGTITLDVPPTAIVSTMSYDTPYIYAGLTTASVTVSDSTAYYDGDVTDVTLTIGNQSTSLSGDGTLSIALDTAGTFTPAVTVTDSRGQTKSYPLDPITVMTYTAPTVTFTAERTNSSGQPDEEGAYATCPSTFVFADAIATAIAPSVVLTDENGTQTTPTVTWYSSRAADGTLSGSVTWSSLSSGDTVYGLIPGLNPNYSYQISIRPRDSEGTGTAIVQTVSSAFYTVDFLAGGHGIAFGQPSSQAGFYCKMDANFMENVLIDLPDYQTTGTTDKAIYDALVALGWDSDVIV